MAKAISAGAHPFPATDGAPLYGFRLVFGSAMIASIEIGLVANRWRHIARHRARTMRGYAIGLGAGTQAFLLLAVQLVAEWRGRPVPIGREPRRARTAGAGGS